MLRHRIPTSLLGVLFWFLVVGAGRAHEIGENYIFLNVRSNGLDGRFEFHVKDLEEKLGITIDRANQTNGLAQAQAAEEKVHAYVRENFSMGAGGKPFELEFAETALFEEKRLWVQYHFRIPLPMTPDILEFDHRMMYENDRWHRGVLVIGTNDITGVNYGDVGIARVFGESNAEQDWNVRDPVEPALGGRRSVWQGILHIWIGIDHILFLVVLLLPAVLKREDDKWQPVENFSKAMWNIVKIVTLFTLAHSVTLALAALQFVRLPGSLVESIIALSIVAVAANNIWPKFKEGAAAVIVGFGLFHGLGFASVLGDLPFQMKNVVKVLLGFNIGVELGQLAIVVAVFGVLFALRNTRFYQPLVLRGVSGLAGIVALLWFIERAFGLSLVPALG